MVHALELQIDVTHALSLGEPARIAATVVLPPPGRMAQPPIVCFAKPGGGYSRHYYTCDLPGPGQGAQAAFHAERGWIFVAMDNLGSGDSSLHEPSVLDFGNLTQAAAAAEEEILLRLANGVLDPDFPPVLQPVKLAIGQSTGGSLSIVQQVRYKGYDGIGILGFSAVHSHPATPPGEAPIVTAWFARDVPPDKLGGLVNASALADVVRGGPQNAAWAAIAWGFHYDDVPSDVVEQDLAHYEHIVANLGGSPLQRRDDASWVSYTTPYAAVRLTLTPGVVAAEAAAVTVPVLSAMGERDLVVDPLGESRAFKSAASFDLFVCPRMGHMHNFAGTRALFWERIHRFGEWCSAWKLAASGAAPIR